MLYFHDLTQAQAIALALNSLILFQIPYKVLKMISNKILSS